MIMNTKKYQILGIMAVILTVFLVSGCTNPNNSSNGQPVTYYKGYDSIDMKFLTNSPPDTFTWDPESPTNEFPITFQLQNKGASDSVGWIYLHGFDPSILSVAGDRLPSAGNINGQQLGFAFSTSNNGNSYSFSIGGGGIYVGLSGGLGSTAGRGAFVTPTGQYYGANVFDQNGAIRGLNLVVNDPSRLGFRLARDTLQIYYNRGLYGFRTGFDLEGNN